MKRGKVILAPACICPRRGRVRVQHPSCPRHGHGGRWLVVTGPKGRKKPGG